MKTIDDVLKDAGITRAQAVDNLKAGALAPARVDSRHTARSVLDPANRYDPAHPDRDPRHTGKGTVVPPTVTPEQQKILAVLSPADAKRFRREHHLPPLSGTEE